MYILGFHLCFTYFVNKEFSSNYLPVLFDPVFELATNRLLYLDVFVKNPKVIHYLLKNCVKSIYLSNIKVFLDNFEQSVPIDGIYMTKFINKDFLTLLKVWTFGFWAVLSPIGIFIKETAIFRVISVNRS